MPRIPQLTASGNAGTMPVPTVSPDTYGAQAGQGASSFAQSLFALDAKQREQQDRLDLARLASNYDLAASQKRAEILRDEPDTKEHVPKFTEEMGKYKQQLLKEGEYSRTVQTAFLAHSEHADTSGAIELATEGRALNAKRQVGEYAQQADDLATSAAKAGPGVGEENYVKLERDLRIGLVSSGAISPDQGVKLGQAFEDRRWSIVAQQTPERIIGIMHSKELPPGMDPQRQHVYTELAFQSMAAQQREHDQEQKAKDARVKEIQEATARDLTADVIEGKSITGMIPGLLRGRSLTDNDGRTLAALEKQMKAEPDLTNWQPSLAPQIEATLSAMKFSPGALNPHVEQNLVSEFIEGHVLKPEFTHLMGIWRGVQEHKQGEGKEAQNKEVGHAHSNLLRDLQTTGPADKFDALSNQTIKDAEEYFYRKMREHPDGDPWQISKDASERFKPVIEQRLNLSKEDKAKLDDAKAKASMSGAGYKAWRQRETQRDGAAIIQDALKNLPPPKEPSFWEKINPFKPKESTKPKAPERKKPGVMRGE